jgi:exodeoxyribonuclease III
LINCGYFTVRVTTLNLNGIRSAFTKGVNEWMTAHAPDVLCVQELKAHEADLTEPMRQFAGMKGYFHFAQKKGYSGVAVYSKKKVKNAIIGFGSDEFDAEGRYVELDFGTVSVISLYLPSGSSGPERQAAKFRFMDQFLVHLKLLKQKGQEIILCGDINIAHQQIDLKNWKSNQKNSGFLPEERAWLTKVFTELGYVDVFRQLDPRPEQYTWWSQRGASRAKNVGWRLDYQIATPGIAAQAKRASIYTEQVFSDHAPVTVDY